MKFTKNFLPGICLMTLFLAGTGIRSHAQETLPYSTNFSNANGWLLENGDCTNAWHIGTPAGNAGKALFISQNGQDTTFAYNKPSRVFAKKLFKMGNSERITVEFDIKVGGGYYNNDYVKVYIMDTNQTLTASSSSNYGEYSPFGYYDYPYCGQFNGQYGISQYNGHVTMQIPNPAKGKNAYLVFLWRNGDHYLETYAYQPAPAITNLSLKETPDNEVRLEMPQSPNFAISGIDSAFVTWYPGRDEKTWEFKLGENGGIGTVSQKSNYMLTGLTNHKKYTFYFRAKKDNFFSEWNKLEIDFNTDPNAWTHGPDTISHDFARLTGAVSYYTESLKPKAFGLIYKKITDENWTYVKTNIRDTWEGQYEIDANASGLSPFTWYAVGAWVVNRDGDTITTEAELPHSFLTYDNIRSNAAPLPYTATFDNNDYWGLSKGFYNWYKGTNGNSGYRLFISPNGTDTAYNGTPLYVNSFAQKKIETSKSGYITVKMKLKKEGLSFMGHSFSNIYAALTCDSVGGFHPWFESKQDLNDAPQGEFTFHLKVPEYYNSESMCPIYLVFCWEELTTDLLYYDLDFEFGDFAAIISSLTVEATPVEIAQALDNCHTPVIDMVDLTSLTSARVYWNWEEQPCQYQVDYGDGRTSPITDCDKNNSYVEVTGLVPNSVATFKLRVMCKDSTWGDWTQTDIDTKAIPMVYVMPVKEVAETSARIYAYLNHEYLRINKVTDFGFEYAEAAATTHHKNSLELEWTRFSYDKIDTIYDATENGGNSLLYKVYASLDNLVKDKTYVVREYATTANGITTYSEPRTFTTSTVRIKEAGETVRMSVSPNPADDYAEIRLEGFHGNAAISMTDMQGRLVYRQNVADVEQTIRISTHNLASGLYIIKVQTQKECSFEKIAIR